MRDSDKWAVIYTTLALIFVVAGLYRDLEIYLYTGALLGLISLYWWFRKPIIKRLNVYK